MFFSSRKCSIWPPSIPFLYNLLYRIVYIRMSSTCRCGLEYLHRSPASRRRRRKGNPVPKGITGPPCHWGTYMQGPGPPGWGFDARVTTLLCKKLLLLHPKKRKPDAIWQNLLRKAMAQKGLFCQRWRWWWRHIYCNDIFTLHTKKLLC
jgi:hypothetical protein